MKLYIWRHNRRFHSYSMIDEPCVHHDLYTDAIAIVMAESQEQTFEMLQSQAKGWRIEDLKLLHPKVIELTEPQVLFTGIWGN